MPNYSPILDSEIDAESPITESLMTRLRDNPLALEGEDYTELTGSGTYTVPSDVNLLKVILIGGGSGGRGGARTIDSMFLTSITKWTLLTTSPSLSANA